MHFYCTFRHCSSLHLLLIYDLPFSFGPVSNETFDPHPPNQSGWPNKGICFDNIPKTLNTFNNFLIFSTQSKDRASWRRGSEVGFGADAGFDELEGATDSIAVSVFADVLVELDQ